MKLYKSLLLGLLMCGFAACDTSDLERDIDSLKDRVTDYEAQVQKLNEDMNIIRVLLDGNKTITEWSLEGDNYVLKLSNGETVTLTPGVVGENYPSIMIGENGNWFIGGNDSGVRAVAKDGEDALFTPQFKIENGNWWVNYENGKADAWKDLGVPATGTPSSATSPVQSVDTSDANVFKITLSDGHTYSIPVIQDLVCEITEPVLKKGEMWMIGGEATLKVKVNIKPGDIIRPVVPADWKAEITTAYAGLTGEQTLDVKVTPPASASKCVVAMEVNRGVNTVTDEIVAQTATTNYYADYVAGLDIKVGDLVINKFTHPDGKLVNAGGVISGGGLFFVEKGSAVTWNGAGTENLIIIGTDVQDYSEVQCTAAKAVSLNVTDFICKGVKISFSNLTGNYVWNLAANAKINNFLFEGCLLEIPENKSLTYFSNGGQIANLFMVSTKVALKNTSNPITATYNLINCNKGTFDNLTIRNCVFYNSVKGKSALPCLVLAGETVKFNSLVFENNTLINIAGNQGGTNSGLIKYTMNESDYMRNNLFWYDNDVLGVPGTAVGIETKSHLMSTASFFKIANFENNLVYHSSETQLEWMFFRTAPEKGNIEGNFSNNLLFEEENPFASVVPEEGSFTYTDAFKQKGIGANL